jgi:hypothetical protein
MGTQPKQQRQSLMLSSQQPMPSTRTTAVVEDPVTGNWVEVASCLVDRAVNGLGWRLVTEDEINARRRGGERE